MHTYNKTPMRSALLTLSRYGILGPFSLGCIFVLSALLLTGRISSPLALVGYAISYASYMLDHVSDAKRFSDSLQSARVGTVAKSRTSHILALAAFVVAVAVTLGTAGVAALGMLLLFPFAVAMHGTSLFGKLTGGVFGYQRIKDIPYAKAFHTALILGLIVPFSAIFLGMTTATPVLVAFFFFYMRCFSNTVACDYKDLERDRVEGVKTLPMALGIRGSAALLLTVDAASIGLVVWAIVCGLWPAWAALLVIGVLMSSIALIRMVSTWQDHEFLSSVVLDSEFTVQLLLTLVVLSLI
jgi:4-hydroxybenzoate polyprenyltransferase